MQKRIIVFLTGSLLTGQVLTGCVGHETSTADAEMNTSVMQAVSQIEHIDSFNPNAAAGQALEVLNNNPYSEKFFEDVFPRLIAQCRNSKSADNADIIWNRFVSPLKESGKVPPDLAVTTWNYHFSKNFVSLSETAELSHYCRRLPSIKQNLEKEYNYKQAGFEVTEQGSPDTHFLNAMYVYNTMWASCR